MDMVTALNTNLKDLSVVESVDELNNSISLILGERTVKLCGDFDTIEKLHRVTGIGEIALIIKFSKNEFSTSDLVNIIHCCIEKTDTRLSRSDIGNLILKSKKYFEYISGIAGFISLIMETGDNTSGKLESQ